MATAINPQNGFRQTTKTFHSVRPPAPLPPPSQLLSVADYTLSLLHSNPTFSPSTTVFLIDSATGHRLTYADFIQQFQSLSTSLITQFPSLHKNQVALILSPTSIQVPIIYYSLLSLGLIISPINPLSTSSELNDLINLSNPTIAFATSSFASKLPSSIRTIIIDSPEFNSMLQNPNRNVNSGRVIKQNDTSAIMYSSGTTGRVKGVELTHRNFISIASAVYHNTFVKHETNPVVLPTSPLFHVIGFFVLISAVSLGQTLVFMERFNFKNMLKAVEDYKVTFLRIAPPVTVAMANSDVVMNYNLSSLQLIGCGGSPLGKEVITNIRARFPQIDIQQGYGMTETGGGITGMIGPHECESYGSVGRLSSNVEAKIVHPETGKALNPMQQGELWLRGPMIMKGYVRNNEATAATLDSEGWLKTGDLCYFDSDGFLYIVDRLKELIKYKAYQVPPAELERYLLSIPEVADAAVIPYPDEEAGQIPMAYIVTRPGIKINGAQIMEIIAKQVSPYKKIRRVAFINTIPKTPAGKILRRELVKHALSAASSKSKL
ncbi:4-coumarate--CoA ligase-like 9 [Rutidosis leptorrhynchoides]|uniref:4-coumarate--CoA ligase-like 9 n=1 Tax=Rutidosis leptorrhynchoides TaxID=125765 RepID=UPI003A98E8A3